MADQNANLYITGFTGLTYADIAGLTGKTLTSAEQTLVTGLIASAESHFASQCRRNFKDLGNTDSYYETFNAGKNKYYLSAMPIKEVRKIELDGVVKYLKGGSSNILTLGVDFFVYDNYIYFDTILDSSVNNRRALKIYWAIENVVGEDIKLGIKQWVSELFLNREFAGKQLNTVSNSGVSMGFDANTIPNYIKQLVSVYQIALL